NRGRRRVATVPRRPDADRRPAPRMTRLAAVALVLVVAAPVGADDPVPLGTCGPVTRRYTPIELPAGRLRQLGGTPAERVGMVAFGRDAAPRPIPFQIDERRGRKLALPDGPEPTADDKPGVLDADDLVVFMACDAGVQRSPAAVDAALAAYGPT